MSWREVVATENTVSKMPQVYNPETGEDEWQSPTVDSPQRSVRAADKQTANELKERQTKELQSFIMQQIAPALKEMSATGRTQLRISPNKIHSFPSLERMGSNELMSQLDRLLGSAFTLGSDGEDLIVDIGRGRDVTRQGKVIHPETGEIRDTYQVAPAPPPARVTVTDDPDEADQEKGIYYSRTKGLQRKILDSM